MAERCDLCGMIPRQFPEDREIWLAYLLTTEILEDALMRTAPPYGRGEDGLSWRIWANDLIRVLDGRLPPPAESNPLRTDINPERKP